VRDQAGLDQDHLKPEGFQLQRPHRREAGAVDQGIEGSEALPQPIRQDLPGLGCADIEGLNDGPTLGQWLHQAPETGGFSPVAGC
jgi:hypothetical protein